MGNSMIQTNEQPAARTRRSPDRGYATVGAVRQNGGSLPTYFCNRDNTEVVWATSARTGRKYLANVSYGYKNQRYYVGANVHKCDEVLARREQADWDREHRQHVAYLAHMDILSLAEMEKELGA